MKTETVKTVFFYIGWSVRSTIMVRMIQHMNMTLPYSKSRCMLVTGGPMGRSHVGSPVCAKSSPLDGDEAYSLQ